MRVPLPSLHCSILAAAREYALGDGPEVRIDSGPG